MRFVYLYSVIQTLVVVPSIARVSRHEWHYHDLVQLKRLINPKYSPHITMHTPIRMILYLRGGIKITVFINTKCFIFWVSEAVLNVELSVCHPRAPGYLSPQQL